MTRTRADVWNLTKAEGDWPDLLRAYELAVGRMRDLDPPGEKPSDPLGWRFQAAIHGLADPSGGPDTSNDLWCSCQHGSWYFLPWHRMYLAAFERIVQHTLEDETWSLPYWYSIDPDDPGKSAVPPAFLDMTLADNNLETSERSETARSGLPFYGEIDPAQVGEALVAALSVERYATPSGRATFGGGERADLNFDGGERGSLENVPHGAVHSLVGNDYDELGNVLNAGWMGSFYTAGLDPLFWLHHANIDRLWEVWLRLDPGHLNPTGDPAFRDTTFTFPAPEGGSVTWSIGEVLDTESLGYVYESLAAPAVLAPAPPEDTRSAQSEGSMPRSNPPQVLGAASDVPLASPEPVAFEIDRPQRPRGPEGAPARAYLRVEGVTGTGAAPMYGVYLNVPEGEDPRDHPELRAGSFSTFGLLETSQTDEQHDAEGLTASFDITVVRDRLAAQDRWDDDRVRVSFSTEVPGAPRGGAVSPAPESEAASGSGSDTSRPDLRARRIAILVD